MRLLYGRAVLDPRTRALKAKLDDFEDDHILSSRFRACACATLSRTCALAASAPVAAPEAAPVAAAPVPDGAVVLPIGMGEYKPGATCENGRTRPTAVS